MVWEGLGLPAGTSLEGKAGSQPHHKYDEDCWCLQLPQMGGLTWELILFLIFSMSAQQMLISDALPIYFWVCQFLLMSFLKKLWI